MNNYDLIVIGAGSGGVRSARWAASLGAKVAICESKEFGGTCVIRGCVPKKMMSYASEFNHYKSIMESFGHQTPTGYHDWSKFHDARKKEISRLSEIYLGLMEKNKVDIYRGHAKFIDKNTIEVGSEKIVAKNIIISTGSKPYIPNIDGSEHFINSDHVFELREKPESIVIYGSGFIAIEMACIFNGLGTKTTLVFRSNQILKNFDHELGQFLLQDLVRQGISIVSNSEILCITKSEHQSYLVKLSNDEMIESSLVLAATGRVPNTEGLNLSLINVSTNDKNAIAVNQYGETNIDGIYAIGDVIDEINLTPVALHQGVVVAENLFKENSTKKAFDLVNIPQAVFSTPPLATVGLSEEELAKLNINYKAYRSTFRPLKQTLSEKDHGKTFMKMLVDTNTDKVLGLHMVGPDAPEMIQGFAVAVKMGATKQDFDSTIGIHPTSAEEFVTLR